jgi:hypothetical protein
MSVKQRLQQFVQYKRLGRNKFEKSVKISLGYLSTKSPSVGSEIIKKIVQQYPDLNVTWLITGQGEMIKGSEKFDPKLVYAPLVSRYAQNEYINNLNNNSYIDTLPILPVIVENDGKGGYMCFEMWDNSMNNGSDNSYNQGDILICKEIDHTGRKRLCLNKPQTVIIIHEKRVIATQIIAHDLEKRTIEVCPLNPDGENTVCDLQDVKKLFNVFRLQRIVN